MSTEKLPETTDKGRLPFLFLVAIVASLLFLWVIEGFVMVLVEAAILSAIAYPFFSRLAARLGGRKSLAAGSTILLGLLVLVIPGFLFLGVLVEQAIDVSEATQSWIEEQSAETGDWQEEVEKHPELAKLLPYQDEILEKGSQLAGKIGSMVAGGLAAVASGTARSLLLLFIMLSALFGFLVDGGAIIAAVLRFTPLEESDKERLLGTFASVGRATLKGTLVVGIIQGGLAGLSFWVAGIEGSLFWAAVMAVLSVVPGIGTALVWVPAVVLLLLNGQTVEAVGVGLWCALVVGTIDNVLRPLLVGKDTEMPELLVMLSTLGGIAAFGASGILLGPIVGALFLTAWRLWADVVETA